VTSDGIRDYVGPEFEKHTGAKRENLVLPRPANRYVSGESRT
jgi:hypothetical protein